MVERMPAPPGFYKDSRHYVSLCRQIQVETLHLGKFGSNLLLYIIEKAVAEVDEEEFELNPEFE